MSLGVVLAPYGKIPGSWPYGISFSMANRQHNLEPYDPQYNQRGEAGFYHDTPLGDIIEYGLPSTMLPKMSFMQRWRAKRALRGLGRGLGSIPTAAELSTVYGYTPGRPGWVGAAEGYIASPWVPPNGYNPMGAYGAPTSLNGLRDVVVPEGATAADAIEVLRAHNDRLFALTLVSTVAVATSAAISFFRTVKLIRESK